MNVGERHLLVIDGAGGDGHTRFELVADGPVERVTPEGEPIEGTRSHDDGELRGAVGGWAEAFRLGGELRELTVDGPATAHLNGERVDPAAFGPALPHVLEVEGRSTAASYEATVDGEIAYDGDPCGDVTVVSGTTVESAVGEDCQRFHFSGTLTDLTVIDGRIEAFVDGEPVDPDGVEELLAHALVVRGTDASGPSPYVVGVEGSLGSDCYRAGESTDATLEGRVAGWLESHWFEGDLVHFAASGDASVEVEYNALDR